MPSYIPFSVTCQGESVFSTYLFTLKIPKKRLEDVEVDCDFPSVFREILGMSLYRVVEFKFDLVPGTTPSIQGCILKSPKAS